jgi:hypothetical protein
MRFIIFKIYNHQRIYLIEISKHIIYWRIKMIVIYTPQDLKEESKETDMKSFSPFSDLAKPLINADLLVFSNGKDNEVFILNNGGLNYKFEKDEFNSIVVLAKMEAEAEPFPKKETVEEVEDMKLSEAISPKSENTIETPPTKSKAPRKKKS